MADERAPFPTLENSTQVGQVLRVAVDTVTPASGINGQIGFAYKDASGNVILPSLNAAGEVPVSVAGTPLRARGSVTGSLSQVTVATLTLAVSTLYKSIAAVVSCRRGGLFELSWNDNGTPTILGEAILDSGLYTFLFDLPNVEITSGATGTQQILVKALNFDKISDLKATITALQI